MTAFSTTDRGNFKTCRYSWDKTSLSRQGLEHALPGKALLLGSLIHYVMADWLQDLSLDPKRRFVEHWMTAEKDIRARYLAKFEVEMQDDELEEKYGKDVGTLGLEMILNYEKHYGSPLPPGTSLIAAEQTATLDITGTRHCRDLSKNGRCKNTRRLFENCKNWGCACCQEHHQLEATFDALVQDTKGRLFVIDHKTYKAKPSQTELAMNDQFLAYTWMGGQLGFGPVVGVYYNGFWKRTWADLLDAKGNPRKSSKGIPYEHGDLFFRTIIPHSKEELLDFGCRLPVELNEMGNNPAIYLNRAWYSCPNCSIQDLCLSKSRGEDVSDLMAEFGHRSKSPAWRAAREVA